MSHQFLSEIFFNDLFVFSVKNAVDDSISIVKESFDNDVTPYFALVICLWGM